MRRVCPDFHEEKDKDWAKRKVARIEGEKRIERIEEMKILSKNAKIVHKEKANPSTRKRKVGTRREIQKDKRNAQHKTRIM